MDGGKVIPKIWNVALVEFLKEYELWASKSDIKIIKHSNKISPINSMCTTVSVEVFLHVLAVFESEHIWLENIDHDHARLDFDVCGMWVGTYEQKRTVFWVCGRNGEGPRRQRVAGGGPRPPPIHRVIMTGKQKQSTDDKWGVEEHGCVKGWGRGGVESDPQESVEIIQKKNGLLGLRGF